MHLRETFKYKFQINKKKKKLKSIQGILLLAGQCQAS